MSGSISKETLKAIIEAIDLPDYMRPYQELRRSGDHFIGKCPFHEDSTPSFHVYADHFHCFGCGKHGDVLEYEMHRSGVSFRDAALGLAERAGVEVAISADSAEALAERERLKRGFEVMEWCTQLYQECLAGREGGEARRYLASRGIESAQAAAWRLGYAPPGSLIVREMAKRGWKKEVLEELRLVSRDQRGEGYYDFFRGRLMIPIKDERGRVIAFGGRVLDPAAKEQKYINSPETYLFSKSRTLFNLDRARTSITRGREAIVVEGYMDCIALGLAGVENVVAVLGTALTPEHIKRVCRFASRLVLCFDSDKAGQAATVKSFAVGFPLNLVELTALRLPEGKDPDEFVRRHGGDAFRALLPEARSLIAVIAESLARSHPSPEARLRAIRTEILPVVYKNPDRAQQEIAANVLAQSLGLASAALLLAPSRSSSLSGASGVLTASSGRGNPGLSSDERAPSFSPRPAAEPPGASEGSLSARGGDEEQAGLAGTWVVGSSHELRLIIGLLYCRWSDLTVGLQQAFESLIEMVDETRGDWEVQGGLGGLDSLLPESRQVIASIARLHRCFPENAPAGLSQEQLDTLELSKEIIRLLAIIRSDLETCAQVGLGHWRFGRAAGIPILTAGKPVFDARNVPYVNFCIEDAALSARSGTLKGVIDRLFSDLSRKVQWGLAWRRGSATDS